MSEKKSRTNFISDEQVSGLQLSSLTAPRNTLMNVSQPSVFVLSSLAAPRSAHQPFCDRGHGEDVLFCSDEFIEIKGIIRFTGERANLGGAAVVHLTAVITCHLILKIILNKPSVPNSA